MAVKFFGQFLLEKGVVGQKALLQAIDLQETTNLKFGATALSMGLLTVEAFERIHDAQRVDDLKFGDMAVKLDILTEAQVGQVLTRQKNNHLYIGEALVRIGALNAEKLKQYLEEFKADQAPYVLDRVTLPADLPQSGLCEIVADLTFKMLTRIVGLSLRPGGCQIIESFDSLGLVATVAFKGSFSGRYLLNVAPAIRDAIAMAILKEESVADEEEEVLNDTVMEFINIVCGNVAAKAAQQGISFDIDPPLLMPSKGKIMKESGETALRFPLVVADGNTLDLVLFLQ